MLVLFLLVFVMTSDLDAQSVGGPSHGKNVVCYWFKWAFYYPIEGQPRFQPAMLDPSLCTHIVYYNAFYDIDKNVIKTLDPMLDLKKDNGMGNFLELARLKETYPHLKLLIAIGDFNDGPKTFSKMSSDPELRTTFVRNVKRFLKRFNFDGLDIHWYYPTFNGGIPEDRQNFVLLAQELNEAFKPRGYILSATIGTQIDKSILDSTYDLENLSSHLDLVHLITWNYHNSGDGVVGANSPLRGADDDDRRSLKFTMDYVLSNGVPPQKVVLGLPFHGRTYNLKEQNVKSIKFGETSTRFDPFKGLYLNQAGYMYYIEICLVLSNSSSTWSYHWDDNTATPYLRDQGRVISFDNARSIAIKIRSAVEENFGGVSIWTIDKDDFLGICTPESHHEAEAYVDFEDRLDNINKDAALAEALNSLNIPDEQNFDDDSGPSYVVSNGRLKLHLSFSDKPVKFKLTHIVNDVTSLAVQEKKILEAMSLVKTKKY